MTDANENFERAFAYLLKNEGLTFVNDKDDAGGPTKFGVTKKTYENFIGREVSVEEMNNLTIGTVKLLYMKEYWESLFLDKVQQLNIAIAVFDTGVLYGIGVAASLAQRTVNIYGGTLKVDGVIGEESVKALDTVHQGDFLRMYRSLILARIETVISVNPQDKKFRIGWVKRANKLLDLSS